MKKILLLATLLLCIVFTVVAQRYQDVVYLKNGSIVRGVITEQVPEEYIKIEIQGGSVFVYKPSEIEKIVKEPGSRIGNNKVSWHSTDYSRSLMSGYKGYADFGLSIGVGDFATDRLTLTTSHGYAFSPYFYAGLGTGLNYYYEADGLVIPIFVNLRSDIL